MTGFDTLQSLGIMMGFDVSEMYASFCDVVSTYNVNGL